MQVAVAGGTRQRRSSHYVLLLQSGASGEQRVDDRHAVTISGSMERGLANVVSGVNVGSASEQYLRDHGITLIRGIQEPGFSQRIHSPHQGFIPLHKLADHRCVVSENGIEERGLFPGFRRRLRAGS